MAKNFNEDESSFLLSQGCEKINDSLYKSSNYLISIFITSNTKTPETGVMIMDGARIRAMSHTSYSFDEFKDFIERYG